MAQRIKHFVAGKEGDGFEFGETPTDRLVVIFDRDPWAVFDVPQFAMVSLHSHLCECGEKWWHSRKHIEEIHDEHAHECPKCKKLVLEVHGWDDPSDKKPEHHHHVTHMTR